MSLHAGTLVFVFGNQATDRLRRTALIVWASIGAIILGAAFLWFAVQIRIIWLPLIFAGGLVIILEPVVRGQERIAIPRILGTIFGFLVLGAAIAAVGFLLVPVVREQARELAAQIPNAYDSLIAWLETMGRRFGIDLGPVWTSEAIREWVQDPENQSAIQDLVGGFGSGAGRLLAGIGEVVAVVGLAPILAFYILLDMPRSRRLFLELTPPRHRAEVAHVSSQVGRALSAFVRGQLLVAIVVGTLSSLALLALGLPFWLIIGMATGLLNLVPFVGPFVGAALAAGVALLVGEPGKAVAAIVIFTLIQQIDNHIITPIIQRTRVLLSPLVIVLALLAGGSLAGLLGVLVAVPTVTVIRILAGHLWRTRILGESWTEASEAMIETTERPELRPRRRRPDNQDKLFDTGELRLDPDEAVTVPREPDPSP